MHHSFIDIYSEKTGFLHGLSPRKKILWLILFIIIVVSTPEKLAFLNILYLFVLVVTIWKSKIPPWHVLKRSFAILPFAVFVGIFLPFTKGFDRGMTLLFLIVTRSFIATTATILIVSSTKFEDILKGLKGLKCPKLFIMILSFMYRYSFVIFDELERMKLAKESRSCGGSKWFQIKTLSNMIGTLFLRSYERSERVYLAMCARGFEGDFKDNK